MKSRYSQAFREQVIQKLLQRGDKTIQCIAEELNINVFTLKHWLRQYRLQTMSTNKTTKRPVDWQYHVNTEQNLYLCQTLSTSNPIGD